MLSEKLVDRLVEGIPDYETLKTTIKQTHERSKGPILAVCITYFIIFIHSDANITLLLDLWW